LCCIILAIINANEVSSPIEGLGTISLSPSLSTSNVLFVPTLNCNFLSDNKLTKSHSCVALFYPTHCYSKTSIPRRRLIAVKREKDCIILKMSHNKPIQERWLVLRMNTYKIRKRKKIWLWHRRLGHPSFGYLKNLFPSLFHKCNISDFICETCVMT